MRISSFSCKNLEGQPDVQDMICYESPEPLAWLKSPADIKDHAEGFASGF